MPAPAVARGGYQAWLVALLCLNFGVLFFDRNALNFLMPAVQSELGFDNTRVGLLASAFSLTWAVAGLLIGNLSDRSGVRKPLLLAATLVYALCSGLSGLVGSFVALFCIRLLMGVAEGGVLPISQALTVAEVAPLRRGLAMGFMQNFGSNLLGSTAASLILIPFAARFGWRKALFLAAVPGLICALLIALWVREPRAETAATRARLSLRQALTEPNILLCAFISIVMVSQLVICFAFMPLYLARVRALDATTMSWLIGTLGVAAGISGFAAPGLSDWIGRKPVMTLLPLLGVVLPLSALYFAGSAWSLSALFFIGWTVIGTFPLFMAIIPSETVDSRVVATALGVIMGAGEGIGGVLAPAAAGVAADRWGLQAPLWIMCVLPLIASLLAVGLRETAPRRRAQEATHA